MKFWDIQVSWTMIGTISIEADSLKEAVEIAKDSDGTVPLLDAYCLDGSWKVVCEENMQMIIEIYICNKIWYYKCIR